MSVVSSIGVPPGSRISREPRGADFFDAYAVFLDHGDRSVLEIYLEVIAATPARVNFMMALRNRLGRVFLRLVAPAHRWVVAAVRIRAPGRRPDA
jgi:hypothetical protein